MIQRSGTGPELTRGAAREAFTCSFNYRNIICSWTFWLKIPVRGLAIENVPLEVFDQWLDDDEEGG